MWAIALSVLTFALSAYYSLHPLYDSEAMYAEAPREMLVSGDFLRPTLNYAPFYFKPPLFLWANAASQALFGEGTLAMRLPQILFMAATVFVVTLTGAEAGLLAGIFAGAALATTYGFAFHAAFMIPDVPLMFFVSCSMLFFLRAVRGSRYAVWGIWLSLAMAVMTKGLLGLVYPGIAFTAFIVSSKRWGLVRRVVTPGGAAVFLAATLPWHIAEEISQSGFLRLYIINEQVMRFFNKRYPPDIDSITTPLCFAIQLGWLMPWTAFLGQSVARPLRSGMDDAARLALCWGLGGAVFLGLSSGKLEYYAMSLFPAFAVLAGSYWAGLTEDAGAPRTGLKAGLAGLVAFSGIVIILALAASGLIAKRAGISVTDVTPFSRLAVRTFIPLMLGSAISLALVIKGKVRWAFAPLLIGSVVMFFVAKTAVDLVAPMASSEGAARAVGRLALPSDIIVVDGEYEYEYSTPYTLFARRKVYILPYKGWPILAAKFDEKDRFLLTDEEFRALWLSGRGVFFATSRGIPPTGIAGVPSGRFREVYKNGSLVYNNKVQ